MPFTVSRLRPTSLPKFFPAVPPGTYNIKSQLTGYKTFDRTGLRLATQQFITLDVMLELGTVQKTKITGAQLTAGDAVTLNIRGNADHPHTVELTAAEVMQVAGGQRVAKSSSTDAFHSHTVAFNG